MPPLEGAEEDASRMEEVRHGLRGGDRCVEVEASNRHALGGQPYTITILTCMYPSGGLIVLLASSLNSATNSATLVILAVYV